GVLALVERLEVGRPGEPDRRAVVPVAPRHVPAVVDADDTRVVAVDERPDLVVVAVEPDRLRVELPPEAVLAEAAVELHPARPVGAPEDTRESAVEGDDRAVEDAVRGRQQVARDHRVPRVAPDHAARAGRPVLPGNVRQGEGRVGDDPGRRHPAPPAIATKWSSSISTSDAGSSASSRVPAPFVDAALHFVWRCGTAARSALVYGCCGLPNTFAVAPDSTTAPRRRITVRSLM